MKRFFAELFTLVGIYLWSKGAGWRHGSSIGARAAFDADLKWLMERK